MILLCARRGTKKNGRDEKGDDGGPKIIGQHIVRTLTEGSKSTRGDAITLKASLRSSGVLTEKRGEGKEQIKVAGGIKRLQKGTFPYLVQHQPRPHEPKKTEGATRGLKGKKNET